MPSREIAERQDRAKPHGVRVSDDINKPLSHGNHMAVPFIQPPPSSPARPSGMNRMTRSSQLVQGYFHEQGFSHVRVLNESF
jgi:hypothetical protein